MKDIVCNQSIFQVSDKQNNDYRRRKGKAGKGT